MAVSVWIPGDQLLCIHPAILEAQASYSHDRFQVVLIESQAALRKRPYHRWKLVQLVSAMRHYAQELTEQGIRVDYRKARNYTDGLRSHVKVAHPQEFLTMRASSYRGWEFQTRLAGLLKLPVRVLDNTQFLSSAYDPFPGLVPGKRIVMENFYRQMRRYYRVLIDENEQPVGGEWNLDKQNRKPLPPNQRIISPISFEPDTITRQVMDEIRSIDIGTGDLDAFRLGVTRAQAEIALDDFISQRLNNFGTYEDAMSIDHGVIFHSMLSSYLNLGLLEPLNVVRRVEAAYYDGKAPLNSVEGFIRQVIGWREYMAWQYWRYAPSLLDKNYWDALRPLPRMFWEGQTQMNCLDHIFHRLRETGYVHHIERLMVLCNFCLLAGVNPREVNEWFMNYFIDAYEWVMPPNVIGMGLFADGGQIATKPYVASANYIRKMSDYCQKCHYDARQRTGPSACPFNFLYWNFLIDHEDLLRANPRLGPNVLGLKNTGGDERQVIKDQAQDFLAELST